MNRAIHVNVNGKKKITGIQTRNENIRHCLIAISLFYGKMHLTNSYKSFCPAYYEGIPNITIIL